MDTIGWIQLVPLAVAAAIMLFESKYDKDDQDSRRTVVRIFSLIAIGCGIAGIIYGRVLTHREQAGREVVLRQQLETGRQQLLISRQLQDSQKEQISKAHELAAAQNVIIEGQTKQLDLAALLKSEQSRGIQQITRLSKDRYLSGIEISYKPSEGQWSKISNLYRRIEPGDGEKSYYETPIIAERLGDRWKIDFEPVELKEGLKWFGYVYTSDKEYKGFESIVREACIGLLVKWSDGSRIDIEPMHADYPTVLSISKNVIALTIRPPMMTIYLGGLKNEVTVSLRGRKDSPTQLRFRSLDASVGFDETFRPIWKREPSSLPRERVKPYVSDSQKIHLSFRTVSGF